MWDWAYELLSDFGEWLKDLLLWLPIKLWEMLLEAFATLFESIPVPDFILQAQSLFNGVGGNVLWVLNLFAVPQGMTMIMTALVLRFALRRIPVIG